MSIENLLYRKFDFVGNHQIVYLVFHVVNQAMVRMEDQCMQLVNCFVSIPLILWMIIEIISACDIQTAYGLVYIPTHLKNYNDDAIWSSHAYQFAMGWVGKKQLIIVNSRASVYNITICTQQLLYHLLILLHLSPLP